MELTLVKFLIFLQMCSVVRLVDESLVLVHVIIRHCDRTPDQKELYSNSEYYNESNFAPFGYGQLTNVGKRRCYNIGKNIRKRYDGFLNASYHYSLIEGRSTDYDRTKESLQLVLAGLFPPTEELMWMEGMNWIPVATKYDKRETDKVLYPVANQLYIQELSKYIEAQGNNSVANKYTELVAYVSQQIGESIDFKKLTYLVRGLDLLEALNLSLPTWTYELYPSPLRNAMLEYFYSTTEPKHLRRLFGGYLLKKIVEDSEKKIDGTLEPRNRKMFIYSGHAFNMDILLVILDHWNHAVPHVGSSLVFELHNINETFGFKIFYFSNSSKEPETISLPGFDEFLPLDEFKILNREYIEFDENSSSLRVSGSLTLMFILLCIYLHLL